MNLDTVRHLYETDGPFHTLHLDVSRDTEDARQQLEARWTTARHRLEELGVAEGLRTAIGERLAEPTHLPGAARRTIVATGDEIVLDDVRAGTTAWPESVTSGPLPDLGPWLSMVDGQVPFVLVQADRLGADIELYRAFGQNAAEETSVDGSELHLTKVHGGDWAHDKYQQRSENQWHENAQLAVEAVRHLVRTERVRLVFLAGDVRACTDIAEMLDDPAVETVQVEGGGRAAGASEGNLWAHVRRHLAALRAGSLDDLRQQVERGLATGNGVLAGPDVVADAMVKGAVERLLLQLEDAREVTVRIGDHPGLTLPTSAMEAGEVPADQALIAAAALTGAAVSVLPAQMPLPQGLALASGTAALLRWDERSPQ